jgi:hypothetical protein
MGVMKRLVVLGLVLTGCVHANVTRLGAGVYPPISPSEVTVLADISELASDTIRYERLAIITLSGSSDGFTNAEDLLAKAREEAALIGANAVIFEDYSPGRASAVSEGRVMAIRYEVVRAAPADN